MNPLLKQLLKQLNYYNVIGSILQVSAIVLFILSFWYDLELKALFLLGLSYLVYWGGK